MIHCITFTKLKHFSTNLQTCKKTHTHVKEFTHIFKCENPIIKGFSMWQEIHVHIRLRANIQWLFSAWTNPLYCKGIAHKYWKSKHIMPIFKNTSTNSTDVWLSDNTNVVFVSFQEKNFFLQLLNSLNLKFWSKSKI